MIDKLALAIGTWLGCGLAPVGPGTAGSIAALGIAYFVRQAFGWGTLEYALLASVVLPFGIWAASRMAAIMSNEDPSSVVVDEVVGQWITLAGATSLNWKSWALAFVLFRAFDIVKPPPIRQLEQLPQGWGIMADDVMAGVFGALCLYGLGYYELY
jgi:phosphatidylglycerophosphatase A